MSELLSGIAPEAIEILKEISRQPNSRLFRYQAKEVAESARVSTDRLSEGHPGLTTAERELVRSYRWETTEIITQLARSLFHRSPYGRKWYTELLTDNTLCPVGSDDESSRRVQRARHSIRGQECLTLLGRIPDEPVQQRDWPQLRELLVAALQLHPNARTRFMLAVSSAATGDVSGTRSTLIECLRNGALDQYRHLCLVSLGIACGAVGAREDAYEVYCLSVDYDPDSAMSLASKAGTALCLDDRRSATQALEQLRSAPLARQARVALARQQSRLWSERSTDEQLPAGLSPETIEKVFQDALLG